MEVKGGIGMRADRLLKILYRLLSGERMTARRLAQEMEVSERTIYRDVEALCHAGVPVVTETGRHGGLRLMEGYALDRALLTPGEREGLLLAARWLCAATGEDGLTGTLTALFGPMDADWLTVDLDRWGQSGARDTRFDVIRRCIRERRELAFMYTGASGAHPRRARPARLCFKAAAWYMQAFCVDRGAFRTFKLSRMSGLAPLDARFEPLPPPPPIEPPPHAANAQAVTLRFAPEAAYRVYDEFEAGSIRAEADGSLTVRACMPLADGWLYGYMLSFGGAATVIEPPEARRGLAEAARRAWERCRDADG